MAQDAFVVEERTNPTPRWIPVLIPSHVTGLIGMFGGYFAGAAIAGRFAHGAPFDRYIDQTLIIGFCGLLLGWLIGVGALTHPVRWVLHLPLKTASETYTYPEQKYWRHFRWNTDHKVIAKQYLVLILFMLSEGGLLAMMIRADLYAPGSKTFPPTVYETVVTMHGMLMIATMFLALPGIFGNFFVPILVGAKDMAFPRLNALSWHLAVAGVVIFNFIPFTGGVETGWTFYSPLADQTGRGADAFAFGVIVLLTSSALGLINMMTTILFMRAPGLHLSRMPFFLWGIIGTAVLTAVSGAAWTVDLIEIMLDRAWGSSFFLNAVPGPPPIYNFSSPATGGGNAWLYEVVFWFFGHPEVYILSIPGWALFMDLTCVFTHKRPFSYVLGVIGLLGVTFNSFFVWGHHLFMSGWEQQLRGYYMFTTETISIPTGFIFFVIVGTLWRGRIWITLPMAWVYAFLATFAIGGATGIYLSDVPLDFQLHGNYFVTAHFHYTIMGSILWAFFGGLYYWFPKMTGRHLDEKLGWIHFWGVQFFFNLTFGTLFYMGLQGLPRRVADYAPKYDFPNKLASISAFFLAAFMVIFLYNVVWSWAFGRKAEANPWGARTLEWVVPTPVPIENFERIPVITSHAFDFGTEEGERVPNIAASGPPPPPGGGAEPVAGM